MVSLPHGRKQMSCPEIAFVHIKTLHVSPASLMSNVDIRTTIDCFVFTDRPVLQWINESSSIHWIYILYLSFLSHARNNSKQMHILLSNSRANNIPTARDGLPIYHNNKAIPVWHENLFLFGRQSRLRLCFESHLTCLTTQNTSQCQKTRMLSVSQKFYMNPFRMLSGKVFLHCLQPS